LLSEIISNRSWTGECWSVLEWQQLVSRSAIYPPKSPNKSTISGVASGRASEREDKQPARHMCSTKSLLCRHRTAKQWGGTGYKSGCYASTRARRVNIHLRSKDNSSPSWRKCPKSIFRWRIILSNLDQKISIGKLSARNNVFFSTWCRKDWPRTNTIRSRRYVTVE